MSNVFEEIDKQIEENQRVHEASLQNIKELAKTRALIITNFKKEVRSVIGKLNSIEVVDIIDDIAYSVDAEDVVDEESGTFLGLVKDLSNFSQDEQREVMEFIEQMRNGHGLDYVRKNMENYLALSVFLPVFMNHISTILDAEDSSFKNYSESVIILTRNVIKEIETYYEMSNIKDLLQTFE